MFHELQRLSAVSGLQQSVGKSAYITKGTLQPEALQFMQDSGLQHETKVRYLGVHMGHVSVKETFVGPLQEAYRRARIAATIALSIPEKITLLTTWILPTLLLTAIAYVADRSVVSALHAVYNMLFCFDSWGITTHQLSQHRDQGGYSVPLPQTWLAAQGGTAAVAALTSPTIMPMYVMQAVVKFCTHYGIPTSHKVIAVTQLGPVPMKGAGYLAHSYKAYSLARKGITIKLSLPLKDLPLWHFAIFCNKHQNTYFAPHLIRQGLLTVAQLFDNNLDLHPYMHKFIPRSWLPIYQQALRRYQALPINDWSPPAVWPGCWAKSSFLAHIAPSKKIHHRAKSEDWKAFWPANLPPSLKDFAYQCMWHKLKVRHRLEPWLETAACPMCGARETVFLALHNCAFYARTHRFMVECFGVRRVNGKTRR